MVDACGLFFFLGEGPIGATRPQTLGVGGVGQGPKNLFNALRHIPCVPPSVLVLSLSEKSICERSPGQGHAARGTKMWAPRDGHSAYGTAALRKGHSAWGMACRGV